MTLNPHTQTSESASARTAIARLIDALLSCQPGDQARDTKQAQTDAQAQRLAGLQLAAAALRDLDSLDVAALRPRQVAVMGPTQAGKSTVVNLLLGQNAAEASPLAGFTVHPVGFALHPPDTMQDAEAGWLKDFFVDWHRRPVAELTRAGLDCYALEILEATTEFPVGTVIWDTPDFDSLKAHSYRRGVMDIAALADVIVLVLSKEKYSDLSVWRFLQLLQPLDRPLLVCLNKVNTDAEVAVTQSLRARFAELYNTADAPRQSAEIEIVTLPHDPAIAAVTAAAAAPVAQLRASLRRRLERLDRSRRAAGVQRLLQTHWDDWTTPIVSELDAQQSWQTAIEAASAQALDAYTREFLEHPQRFDSFRRAIAELLLLMEVPVLAQSLARIRQALTWPARQLFARVRDLRRGGHGAESAAADLPAEERVLRDLLEQLLTTLARDALRRAEPQLPAAAFWQALSRRLAERHTPLMAAFAAAVHRHHEDFQPEIEATARQLYATLQQKPALLNTLRAARATTDAAAIALAVKTAGLGVNDLLFAPAMLALTSMLTESAVGGYMNHVARDLRQRQYQAVATQIFQAVVEPQLRNLGVRLDAPGLLGIGEAEYRAATTALKEWPHD